MSRYYLIKVNDEHPFIQKSFLNEDKKVFLIEGTHSYIEEEDLKKLAEYKGLFDKSLYPLDKNEEYRKYYGLDK